LEVLQIEIRNVILEIMEGKLNFCHRICYINVKDWILVKITIISGEQSSFTAKLLWASAEPSIRLCGSMQFFLSERNQTPANISLYEQAVTGPQTKERISSMY